MHRPIRLLGLAAAIGLAVTATSMLHAAGSHGSGEPMTGRGGMMGMMDMMGMGGMMDMMRGKDGMMENCPMMRRMRGDHTKRPNEQWREKPPAPKQGR